MDGSAKFGIPDPGSEEEVRDAEEQGSDSETPLRPAIHENPFELMAPPAASRIKQVWAVGGGKGGVGKSLLASSIAITLSRLGFHVVAMDLDLGGANLHTTFGVDLPKKTLSDLFSR